MTCYQYYYQYYSFQLSGVLMLWRIGGYSAGSPFTYTKQVLLFYSASAFLVTCLQPNITVKKQFEFTTMLGFLNSPFFHSQFH